MLAASSSFIFSSIICACATSMPMLIAGRALQGAGAGAMLLLVSVIISNLFDLRNRTFYLGLIEVFWIKYYLPFFFQSCQGFGPLFAGLLALPLVFIEALCGVSDSLVVHRTGKSKQLIWAAVLLLTLGFGLFIYQSPSTSLPTIIVIQIVAGTGSGLLFQPPATALQANVSHADTASATSTQRFLLDLSEAISLVLGATIFNNFMTTRQSKLLAAGIPLNIAQMNNGRNAAANVNSLKKTLTNLKQVQIIRAAYSWSLRNMWIHYASIASMTVLMALLIQPHELST